MREFWLSDTEVDHFLRLISVERDSPNLDLLSEVITKTLEKIPFQNLTMLSNKGTIPTIKEIKSRMLSGIGGICTIRNPFIHQVLLNLGFDAKLVSATIMQPGCHIAIIVKIGDNSWWCDPGNGFPYFSVIKLGDYTEKIHPFLTYRLIGNGNSWEIQHLKQSGKWLVNYHFKLEFKSFNEFDDIYINHYTVEGYGPFLTGLRYNVWSLDDWTVLRDKRVFLKNNTIELRTIDELKNWMERNTENISKLIGSENNLPKLWEVVA